MTVSEYSTNSMGYEQQELIPLIPHMRAFARMLCRDSTEADDLTQEALASALKSRGAFRTGTSLKSWLFTIVRNQFYSDKRRSWRIAPLDQKMAEETLVALSDPMSGLELADVRAAMQLLCEEQREALILVSVAGLAYEEAAQVCGVPRGTIKSRVNRARHRLEEILAGDVPIDRETIRGGAMASLFLDADRLTAGLVARNSLRAGASSSPVWVT